MAAVVIVTIHLIIGNYKEQKTNQIVINNRKSNKYLEYQ